MLLGPLLQSHERHRRDRSLLRRRMLQPSHVSPPRDVAPQGGVVSHDKSHKGADLFVLEAPWERKKRVIAAFLQPLSFSYGKPLAKTTAG